MMIRRLKLRARYYWRETLKAFGVCPTCRNRMYRTRGGRLICTTCANRRTLR